MRSARVFVLAVVTACTREAPVVHAPAGPASSSPPSRSANAAEVARAPATQRFEVVGVADDLDVLANVADATADELEIRVEHVPVGTDAGGGHTVAKRHFARVARRRDETTDAAIRRGETWARTIATPPGTRLAWQPLADFDPDTGASRVTAVRSYLLEREPILTGADVVEATALLSKQAGPPEPLVSINLTPAAGQRFAKATRERINRRIAIVVDGRVNIAPVVRAAIDAGRLTITMGSEDDVDVAFDRAKSLARSLGRK